jgi:WD40 repeat protein
MSRLDFPERADTFGISTENSGKGRLYKTYFPNHDEGIVSMLAKISSGEDENEEMMTVDSLGGLTIIDIDPMSTSLYKCRTLELFHGKKLVFTCSDYNSSAEKLFLGTITGAIWETDFESVRELNTNHKDEVTAIVSTQSTLFSAGKDRIVCMYSTEQGAIIATVSSEFDIRFLHIFTSIRGFPLAIADSSGCVSVWSPSRLKKSKQANTVQNVCNLNENLIALFQAVVLGNTAMVCVTNGWIRIWGVAIELEGAQVLSILNDEVFSLMRSIEAPDRVTFTTGCVLNSEVPSILTGCSDGSILQWEPNFGSQIRRFDISTKPTSFILYIPSQEVIVSCDVNNTLCVIDPFSTPCVSQLGPISSASVTCAAACEVSRIVIAVGDADGRIFKYDGTAVSSSTLPIDGHHAVTALEVMITKISNHVVAIAGYANGTLETYIFDGTDPADNCEFSTATKITTQVYASPVTFIRNADDDRVITACEDGETYLWNVSITGVSTCFEKIKVLENCTKVHCIGINPRNDIFAMGSMQGDLMLWDTKRWQEITSVTSAHGTSAVRSVGFMFSEKKLSRYIVSVGATDSLVKCWKLKANKLTLENTIELPATCERAEVWGREESSLLFVQTKTGLLYVLDILNNSLGPLRFFSIDESACSFWQVCGTHTAMFMDVDDQSGKINVWNNDLTPAESSRVRVLNIFNECLLDSHHVSPALDAVLRSHPLFPTFLLETDPNSNCQTLFSKAILGRFSHFVTTYLPTIPAAVLQPCMFKGRPRSLLWLALKMKDFDSIECIVEIWMQFLVEEPDTIEMSSFSNSEMMNDLKILSRELPAKFAEMVSRLSIPRNHVINMDQCHSRFIRHGHYWMRGSGLRTVRGFWSHVERRPYPDLATRRLEPDEEAYLYHLEAPHASHMLQMPFTDRVESSERKAHPSIRYAGVVASPEDSIVLDDWDEDDLVRLGKVNRKKFAPEQDKGTMVQAYIHPLPYAAAGTEFLKLCQRCSANTGRDDVMSSPAVTTVLDYKWHTYFKDLHHASLFHYAFVLVLFTFHCIYFDHMMDSPAITGLPILALVVALFLILSYVLLLAQETITFLNSYLDPTRKMWFCVGVLAYVIAIAGLSIQLRAAFYEVHMNSSFTSRSVLSVATIFLYFKFLNYMT